MEKLNKGIKKIYIGTYKKHLWILEKIAAIAKRWKKIWQSFLIRILSYAKILSYLAAYKIIDTRN